MKVEVLFKNWGDLQMNEIRSIGAPLFKKSVLCICMSSHEMTCTQMRAGICYETIFHLFL
jgi:hypothetical protein